MKNVAFGNGPGRSAHKGKESQRKIQQKSTKDCWQCKCSGMPTIVIDFLLIFMCSFMMTDAIVTVEYISV